MADSVKWLAWNEQTFEKAKKENKLVLLDISAVWCHWCHVMDEGTYANPEVVALVNENFIPVRVDNDERPDINSRYNCGGWPTTAILTPQANMVDGYTYLDAVQMKQFLQGAVNFWKSNGSGVDETFEKLNQKKMIENLHASTEELHETVWETISGNFDPEFGGFGAAPKFPMAEVLDYVYYRARFLQDEESRTMLEKTLLEMGNRGMYDSVQGGFFRYSTTKEWSIPHYEKMLEDNARHIPLYFESATLLNSEKLKAKAAHALEYVQRTLKNEDGTFAGSQDADEHYYSLGKEEREKTKRPFVDRRAFTDWNAMMVRVLCSAFATTGEERYKKQALDLAEVLEKKAWKDGKVFHIIGKQSEWLLLKDAAWMLQAFLEAYQLSFDEKWKQHAETLFQEIHHTFGKEDETFFDSANEKAFGALKERHTQVNENALVANALLKLAFLTEKLEYAERAEKIVKELAGKAKAAGIFGTLLEKVSRECENGLTEYTVYGKKDARSEEFLKVALKHSSASTIVKLVESEDNCATVCRNKICSMPLKSAQEFEKVVGERHD